MNIHYCVTSKQDYCVGNRDIYKIVLNCLKFMGWQGINIINTPNSFLLEMKSYGFYAFIFFSLKCVNCPASTGYFLQRRYFLFTSSHLTLQNNTVLARTNGLTSFWLPFMQIGWYVSSSSSKTSKKRSLGFCFAWH